MKKLGKITLLFLSPVLICIVLTILGIIFKSVPLISFSGFVLFFVCFLIFGFADKILEFFKSAHSKTLDRFRIYLKSNSESVALQIVDWLGKLPIQAAIFIRAISLSISFWLVGLYVSLAGGEHQTFFDSFEFRFLKTFFVLILGAFDTIRGKTIEKPGLPARTIAIWGAFHFLANLFILAAGIHSADSLSALKGFFSTPLWFMESNIASDVVSFAAHGLLAVFIFFLVFPIIGIVQSHRALAITTKIDAKNFNIAGLIFFFWLLTLPIFLIYILVNKK